MGIEEEYQDVLQNMEGAVAALYRSHPEMTDFAVQQAYDALLDTYGSEQRGTQPRNLQLNEIQQELYDSVRAICEWRLGRDGGELAGEIEDPIDLTVIIRCLRKLQKSVPKWTKRSGRQGYLNFISQFV